MAVTLAGLRAYEVARGFSTATTANDTDANAALVRGGDYIEINYLANILPQYVDDVPEAFEKATYEASLLELATPNIFSVTATEFDALALTTVDKIGWDYVGPKGGSGSAASKLAPVNSKIDNMLKPYISTSKTKPLLRA